MPSLSAEQKAKLILATRQAASAFVEDLKYLREVVQRLETSRGELRRISSVLRRLLVDGDLGAIAAPRIGRMLLQAPNNEPVYDLAVKNVMFFGSAGVRIFGLRIRAALMANVGKPKLGQSAEELVSESTAQLMTNFGDLFKNVDLRIDRFLSQRIICYSGQWISRLAAIKYIANFASGVHSNAPVSDDDKMMDRIRASCSYGIREGRVHIHMLPELGVNSFATSMVPPENSEGALDFDAAALDPLLVEMLATAHFLLISPDVGRLEEVIQKELAS